MLVVDDDPSAAGLLAALLADLGLPAMTAADGDAALHAARSTPVRLVVSEIYVPCSEGTCVVAALKQDRHRLPHLRILVHTRHASPADLAYALANGADVFVPKSAPRDVLLREVHRLDALTDNAAAAANAGAAAPAGSRPGPRGRA